MATKLSDNDFQRLQENLIELKSRNYTLEEQNRKYKHGLGDVTARAKVLEEENKKLSRVIEKSKRAQEVQQLSKENSFLQEKLNFQDEQFRHQNQTLMFELNELVKKNEKLEQSQQKKPAEVSEENVENNVAALTKLEGDNKDLLMKLERLQKKYDDLQQTQHADKPDHDRDRLIELEKEVERLEDVEFKLESTRSEAKLLEQHNSELKTSLVNIKAEHQDTLNNLSVTEDKLRKKQELILQFQTEKETIIANHRSELTALTSAKDNELMAVSEHRDRLQLQLNQSQESLLSVRESSNSNLEEHLDTIQSLKSQLAEFPPEKFRELEASKICLFNQLQSVSEEASGAQARAIALLSDLENAQAQNDELHRQNESNNEALATMERELASSQSTCESRKVLIDEMATNLNTLRSKELELTKTLEENSKASQEKVSEMQQKLDAATKQLTAKKSANDDLKNEQENLRTKLTEAKEAIEKAEARLQEAEADKETLRLEIEARLGEQNDKHRVEVEAWETKLNNTIATKEEELESLTQEFANRKDQKITDLRTEIELASAQRSELEDRVEQLEQDLRDAKEDKKLMEKKGQALLKDVKRQLVNEKRRNEKLQEKMKECFIDTQSNHSEPAREAEFDRSSISSWSLMSGNNERERSSTPSQVSPDIPISLSDPAIHQNSPIPRKRSPGRFRPIDQRPQSGQGGGGGRDGGQEGGQGDAQETDLLLERIAAVQQEKWALEERLNMVEQSGAAMAEEIFRKNTLISFYCMEAGREGRVGRAGSQANNSTANSSNNSDKSRMKNFMDRLVNPENNHIHENKEVQRMQQMLEETLTKNMVLQQNMDSLSQEVVRLSKLVPTGD